MPLFRAQGNGSCMQKGEIYATVGADNDENRIDIRIQTIVRGKVINCKEIDWDLRPNNYEIVKST